MAGFIAAQRDEHHVPHATACRVLGVSQAWFYKWRYGDASPWHARRRALAAEIARLFAAHQGKYGSPRITDDLREAGWRVSVNTVAFHMRNIYQKLHVHSKSEAVAKALRDHIVE